MLLALLFAIALLVGVLFLADKLLLGVIPKEWVVAEKVFLAMVGLVIASTIVLGVSLMVLVLLATALIATLLGIAAAMSARTTTAYFVVGRMPFAAYLARPSASKRRPAYASSLVFCQDNLI